MDEYQIFIGTKVIKALSRPKDGKDGYEVVYDDGYTSWSPKEVFETHYRLVTDAERKMFI